MLGTDVMALDDVDKLVQAFEDGDDQALMEATGQSTGGNRQVGLPRLNINYDAENDEGVSLEIIGNKNVYIIFPGISR